MKEGGYRHMVHRTPLHEPRTALDARDLCVALGKKRVLDGITLAADTGRVLALLGPNGAGKTTLFRVLLGMLEPDGGTARLLGEPCTALSPEARARIAFVGDSHAEQGVARVSDLEELRAAVYPRFRTAVFRELAAAFRLDRAARVRELSRGQRAGLALALALGQTPELLVLDEPTLGLDPPSRREVLSALVGYGRDGESTMVFASHELVDIERIADDVAFIRDGRVTAAGEFSSIVDSARGLVIPGVVKKSELAGIQGVLRVEPLRDETRILVFGEEAERADTLAALARVAGDIPTTTWPVSFEECALGLLEHPSLGHPALGHRATATETLR
jgi:ABC-2 type transport system ATP-binding protein